MSIELLVILVIGAAIMCFPIAVQMKFYEINRWKSVAVSVALVATGVIGSEFWFFVENGYFGGRSFFGAVFMVPIVFIPLALTLHIPYSDLMDTVAPAGSLTLALVKIQCLRDGCCIGKILYVDSNYMYVRFPSQIAEMLAFIVLALILFYLSVRGKNRGTNFQTFLILYGIVRYVLNYFRDESTEFAFGLPAGNVWSILSIIVGAIWYFGVIIQRNTKGSIYNIATEE